MALSNFTKELQNIVDRAGGVYASDDGGTTWYSLGEVKDIMLDWTAVTTDPDSAGRPKQLGADVELTWVMQQTSDTELTNLDALTDPSGNGIDLKFTSEHTNAAGAGAADGYQFSNAVVVVEGSINFMGEESNISCASSGRVPISELINLGVSQTLTFDA